MKIDNTIKTALKARAHHLKPVIRIGQHGVSESLVNETHIALDVHELIKVHIQEDDREIRKAAALDLAKKTHALMVHSIGKTFVLYRKKTES